jgi:hypothetical protein
LARALPVEARNAGDGTDGKGWGLIMRQAQQQLEMITEGTDLMDRVEDAVLSVHPDLWLAGLMLAVLINWLA